MTTLFVCFYLCAWQIRQWNAYWEILIGSCKKVKWDELGGKWNKRRHFGTCCRGKWNNYSNICLFICFKLQIFILFRMSTSPEIRYLIERLHVISGIKLDSCLRVFRRNLRKSLEVIWHFNSVSHVISRLFYRSSKKSCRNWLRLY